MRDYAATFRFQPAQTLNLFTNYTVDAQGFPVDPDPPRKLLIGFAAGPDRYENWLSNRLAQVGTVVDPQTRTAVRQPAPRRTGRGQRQPRRRTARAIPGFLVPGAIENGATGCPDPQGCPDDTRVEPAGDRRAHRQRRAAVGRGPGRLAVHRRLREHRRVPEAAARGRRQLPAPAALIARGVPAREMTDARTGWVL